MTDWPIFVVSSEFEGMMLGGEDDDDEDEDSEDDEDEDISNFAFGSGDEVGYCYCLFLRMASLLYVHAVKFFYSVKWFQITAL